MLTYKMYTALADSSGVRPHFSTFKSRTFILKTFQVILYWSEFPLTLQPSSFLFGYWYVGLGSEWCAIQNVGDSGVPRSTALQLLVFVTTFKLKLCMSHLPSWIIFLYADTKFATKITFFTEVLIIFHKRPCFVDI